MLKREEGDLRAWCSHHPRITCRSFGRNSTVGPNQQCRRLPHPSCNAWNGVVKLISKGRGGFRIGPIARASAAAAAILRGRERDRGRAELYTYQMKRHAWITGWRCTEGKFRRPRTRKEQLSQGELTHAVFEETRTEHKNWRYITAQARHVVAQN